MENPPEEILDATCGGRSIWHPENKDRDDTLYIDRREEDAGFVNESYECKKDPGYEVSPDEVQDFRDLPHDADSFNLVVFDPPHCVRSDGMETLTGFMEKKYGALHAETWQSDLKQGFDELWRVLKPGGTLVFKFADRVKDFDEILDKAPVKPLFGTATNRTKTSENRFFVFYKPEDE